MPGPIFKVKTTYFKPLTGNFRNVDPTIALRQLRTEMLRRIKAKLTQETFSERAKKALARTIEIKVQASSLVIIAKHPAFRYIVGGQREGQMTWLTKAKRPIPIVTETGELIFRSATPKSMADGKWYHPGRRPSTFIERARQEARAFMRDKLYREYVNQARRAISRR